MLYPMETFVLIILALLAAVVLFWLLIYPTVLLAAAGWAMVTGAIKGVRSTTPPSISGSTH